MADHEKGSIFRELQSVDAEKRHAVLALLMAQKTRQRLQPNHVTLEITPLCTLNCKMCYIKDEGLKSGATKNILLVEQWKRIADQVIEQGVESITLTGGEALTYKGFFELYNYIYDRGVEITVMSNATLIDDSVIDRWIRRPPKYICVTLYGMSENTYKELCGSAVYSTVVEAIDRMQKAKLPVILQSTITKDNENELPAMIEFAKARALAFRYSWNLFSARECSLECVKEERAVAIDQTEKIARVKAKLFSGDKPKYDIVTHGMRCGAARNSYHINWRGYMQPCILFDAYQISVLENPVELAWRKLRDWALQVPQLVECQECPAYHECGQHCIASHYRETGEFGKTAAGLCWKQKLLEDEMN